MFEFVFVFGSQNGANRSKLTCSTIVKHANPRTSPAPPSDRTEEKSCAEAATTSNATAASAEGGKSGQRASGINVTYMRAHTTDRQTDRDRQTHRQACLQTYKQTHTHTHARARRQRDRQRQRQSHTHTPAHACIHTRAYLHSFMYTCTCTHTHMHAYQIGLP